MGLEQ
jgi:hypothetical protein